MGGRSAEKDLGSDVLANCTDLKGDGGLAGCTG